MQLINEGEVINMFVVDIAKSPSAQKYNLIIMDCYNHEVVNRIFVEYGNSIESVSFYKNGHTTLLNDKYLNYKNATIYINTNNVKMFDFVLRDEDIVIGE